MRSVVCRGYRFAECGRPSQVLKKEEWVTPFNRSSGKAVVRMIAAPVHHHDKWAIMGQFGPHQPGLPAVAGSEGVGEVEEVGSECSVVKPGDYVVFNRQDVGTWATHVVADEATLDRVPKDIEPEHLSMMNVYGTAWRLVHDYGKVKPGDVVWVLGRGAVGTAAASLLHEKGATVFVIMRKRLTEEENDLHRDIRNRLPGVTTIKHDLLGQRVMQTATSDLPKPKLILNGMGGDTLRESLRFAADGCKVVTFGNMSRQPLSVSVGRHLFSGIQLLHFWYGRYLARSTREEREAMYASICDQMRTGAHANPYGSELHKQARFYALAQRYVFDTQFEAAFNNAFTVYNSRKPVLRFGEPYEWTHSGEWHKEAEVAQPRSQQYLEGMHGYADAAEWDWKAAQYGHNTMVQELREVVETDGAKAFREAHSIQPFDMKTDHHEVTNETVQRYLETEGKMYGFRYQVRAKARRQFDVPGITKGFYPDDDPVYQKSFEQRRQMPGDYVDAHAR